MSLSPLFAAPFPVQIHVWASLAALALGLWQLAAAKGDFRHRRVGLTWVGLMAATAASSFLINDARQFGPFSVIHILSAMTLIGLPLAVRCARRGWVRTHAALMLTGYFGGLVFAGGLALAPGRLVYEMLWGG